MGIILNVILIIIFVVVITGGIVYNNPQKAKVWAISGIKKILPEVIDITPEEIIEQFKDTLPIKDMIGKNPEIEQDFDIDIPFQKTSKEILGRPKKVVEFFCTSDLQCKNYFLRSNAQCESESGICYI